MDDNITSLSLPWQQIANQGNSGELLLRDRRYLLEWLKMKLSVDNLQWVGCADIKISFLKTQIFWKFETGNIGLGDLVCTYFNSYSQFFTNFPFYLLFSALVFFKRYFFGTFFYFFLAFFFFCIFVLHHLLHFSCSVLAFSCLRKECNIESMFCFLWK